MPAATQPASADDRQVLAALRERAAEQLDSSRAALVAKLAEAAYRRAPAEALARVEEDPDGVVAWLDHAVDVLDHRAPGTLRLTVRDDPAGTIVEVSTEDSPFLVSTVLEELTAQGQRPAELLHPVLGVERDADDRLLRLQPAREAAERDSFIWLRLPDRLDEETRGHLRDRLERVLNDARAATRDFRAMTERAAVVAERIRELAPARWSDHAWVEEVGTLLDWLRDDHFVWLGARDYDLVEVDGQPAVVADADSGLGILAVADQSMFAEPVKLDDLPEAVAIGVTSDNLLTVARTNRASTVHKRVRMISMSFKKLDDHGAPVGEHRFVGLFAQRAYAEPASAIPVLRRKLERILAAEDVVPHSHDERSLRTLFEAFPKHELFAADTERLRATIVDLLEAQRRQHVRLWCRTEPDGRGVSAVLTVPRERFNARLRMRVQRLLADRFGTEQVDYHLSLAEGDTALLHFVLHVDPRAVETVDQDALEREVIELTRTWDDALAAALRDHASQFADAPDELVARWYGAFDDVYQAATEIDDAVDDIAALETVRTGSESVAMRLTNAHDQRAPLRARLVKRGAEVELSEFVPILESLGLVVVEQVPHRVTVADTPLQLHDFGVRPERGRTVDVERDRDRVAEAVVAIWHQRAQADLLNRLVLDAGLGWRDVSILRAYRRYRRQVGTAYTETYQDEAIVSHPDVARALVRLFRARVDPREDGSDDALAQARRELDEALEQVQRLDQDRILRRLAGTVEATTRSNVGVEVTDTRGSDALGLKLDSARVPDLPQPVPYAEIFVHHAQMEGIHLRGGPVARGGIRASDRREDYRSEVLGLMKAQMTKNSVIVPTGAKGGFVLHDPPPDRDERSQAFTEAYRRYVRALLDVSDDINEGELVPPPAVRRRDGDDPYIVVAPDKGTATLSDEANAIAEQYGFWLRDAFASGGSSGYDHKRLGVTARGAWVAVQRHFRELGVDVQTEPIRVVGIGDMGGDVFGNGLLRSRSVQLVAAFNHRDVFIDPNPDPEASFDERARLFGAADSGWQAYDPDVLSEGGGVWSRDVKTVPLSEPVRTLVGVEDTSLPPPELIRAILRCQCDLLFFGGIGTFIKSSSESHGDVADRASDGVRVDASEVRARVIGEGANLGVTQRGRIEYARRGGRINTDAIDNAAGVGTSDREVNLKIALQRAIENGEIHADDRDRLLREMTEDVVDGVLSDLDRQTGAISHELDVSPDDLDAYGELMTRLEHHREGVAPAGRLNRELEVVPDRKELTRRSEAQAGLTRPEVAVLLGYTKLDLRDTLVGSPLPDDEALDPVVQAYFPPAVSQTAPKAIATHPLRRELVATRVTNDVVDRMGLTWVDRTARQLGREAHEVVAAYWVARSLLDAEEGWRIVERYELDCDPLLLSELRSLVGGAVNVVARAELGLDVDRIGEAVERHRHAARAITDAADRLGSDRRRERRQAQIERYVDLGVEPEHANRLLVLGDLAITPDVGVLSERLERPPRTVADVHLRVADALPFERLAELLASTEPKGLWQRWQRRGLEDELAQARRAVAARVLRAYPERDAAGAVASFLNDRPEPRKRVELLVERLTESETPPLDGIAVAVRVLRESFAAGE